MAASAHEGAAARRLYSTKLDVRWSDLDADGVVNNVVVLRFVEEARMQWSRELELDRTDPGLVSAVARLECDYRRPIGYPACLSVDIRCEKVGNSSLCLAFDISDADADGDALFARAGVVWVWVDRTSRRPAPMPARLRACCVTPDSI